MSKPPSLELPPGARAYRLRTARGAFAVLDAGEAARGTALLVPGYTGSKEDFLPLLAPLAAAGFRTVAVDGRGQYESAGPAHEDAYAQHELVLDVHAQTAALGTEGPLHLLGHSMGGHVARAAVLRDARPYASLTLMSSGPAAVCAPQQERLKLLLGALAVMDMEEVWQAVRAMDPDPEGDLVAEGPQEAAAAETPDEVSAFLHARWLATSPAQLTAAGRQLLAEPDRTAELAGAGLPLHVVSGTTDDVWPVEWMDDMASRLGARRTVVDGAAHSPNAEQPGATAAALAGFWTDVPRRASA